MMEYISRGIKQNALGPMFDDSGNVLHGIVGSEGAKGLVKAEDIKLDNLLDLSDFELGLDEIVMDAGTEFPLHIHPGAHILYILDGPGIVHIDDVDYEVNTGDSIYVPAVFPHGVKTSPKNSSDFKFVAIGYPHHKVDSTTRMTVVRE